MKPKLSLMLLVVCVLPGCTRRSEVPGQQGAAQNTSAKQAEIAMRAQQEQTPHESSQNGFEIEYKVREPKNIGDRFAFAKDLRLNDYVPWMMDAGGVFGQMVGEVDNSPDQHYVEVLLVTTNKSDTSKRFDIAEPFLEDGVERRLPWECLPGNAFGSYAELDRQLSLSRSPLKGNLVITFNLGKDQKWRGRYHTSLKPGQKAWVELIFLLPKTLHSTKLHFASKEWNPIEVVI